MDEEIINSDQQFLDLSYLELTEIPKTIFNYPHELNTLNLTGNLLKAIPEALEYAVSLQTLYLDENDIQYIGDGDKYGLFWAFIVKLEHKFYKFYRVFPAMNKLEFLSISYGTLKSIGEGAFSQLPALKTLMVTNNPHLSIIHPNALSRKGKEDPRRLEYPPLTNVNYLLRNYYLQLH